MRKIYLIILLLVVAFGHSFAQSAKPLKKRTNIHYFSNKRISTYEVWDDRTHGHVYALDKKGKKIYTNEIGYFGGSHNTSFTYYPDGMVQTIHTTMQPDGGIQHYETVQHYSPTGKLEGTDDHSTDGHII